MTTWGWRIHRPRQVIVVVFLTSVFWFLLNTFILFTYQGYRPADIGEEFRRTIRGEGDELLVELERASKNRESSKLRFQPRDKVNIRSNIAGGIENADLDSLNIARGKFGSNTRERLGKRILPSFSLQTEQTFSRKRVATGTISDVSWNTKRTKFLDESTSPSRDPKGPGEQGRAVTIGEDEKDAEKEGYSKHAFNELASRKISLHRSIPDTRNPG